MNNHYYSVFYNEQELLKAILKIHIKKETFDIDPMFYKGGFYKEIPKPSMISDIRGKDLGVTTLDARNLPLENNSLDSIILDPPFIIANRPSQLKSYTTNFSYYKSLNELISEYQKLLLEAKRLLKKKGICVFKCQDYTDSKTIMTHVLVAQLAIENNYYIKDLAILVNEKNKIYNKNLNQKHFRKIHTYFWILEKRKGK